MTIANTLSLIAIAISVIVGGASIYFNSKNSKHTDTKDLEEEVKQKIDDIKERERERAKEIEERTRENTIINTKLDNINFSNQEIKERLNNVATQIQEHGERLIKVEESCKSAHHRLDTIENRLNKEDDE